MRLGFFTMPMHPPGRSWVETLKEDRQAFILADKLGFYDAFCGEHIADSIENVTNSFQFLATLDSRNQDDQARHRHGKFVADPSGADRRACGDVRSSLRRPFHSRRQRRCAARGCGTARHARRRPPAHFPRGARRDPRTVDDRAAVQFRPAGQPLQDFQRKNGQARIRARRSRQAVPEALSGNCRHRGRAAFRERDLFRREERASTVGKLSAAALGEDALGCLLEWRRFRRRQGRSGALARRAHSVRRRRRQDRETLRAG